MASRFRVLAVVLIAAVVALLWVPAAGAASDVAGQPPALHLYDGHDRESVRTAATTGPPVAFDHTATPEAVDRQSCGSSASPSARTSPAIYNYGDTALPARTARGSHGVEGSNRGGTAACAVVQRLSVAAKSADEGVDLFRHVSPGELTDIGENGFRAGPGSLDGKWFAESGAHASEWGRVLNGGEGSVVRVRVPNTFADQLMRLEKLDGIGPARYVEPHQLAELNRYPRGLR